jgi:hypothetical protein
MKMRMISVLALLFGGASACGPSLVPGAGGSRESGQSKLMDQTFAGKNACNPDNHERPFIIEWDATDMSSFEQAAANDLVVVRYEECKLTVLDGCRDDSIRGSVGTYRPVEWTSGSLEKMEISDEGELYAKLPLGVASLGARVSGGERFRMEYYVAGTRTATRPAIYQTDISTMEGCSGATHFVYAYNLGAFALGSVTNTSVEAEGSLYGFGAGGSKRSSTKADKQGGSLPTCKSDSAKEIEGCKVPIRLTLRAIDKRDNPEIAKRKAPDTDASLNAAAQIEVKMEIAGKAGEHMTSAQVKMRSRDGKGCLAELDQHDRLEPKSKSTDPKSGRAWVRAQCLMLAGKCDAGKQLARKHSEAQWGDQFGPEHVDRVVEATAGQWCQGKMSDRDALVKALQELTQGAYMTKKDVAFCRNAYNTAKKLLKTVKPKDDDDMQIVSAPKSLYHQAATCAARAGDCNAAYQMFADSYPPEALAHAKDDKAKQTSIRQTFDTIITKCKK